jgi:MFS family permease
VGSGRRVAGLPLIGVGDVAGTIRARHHSPERPLHPSHGPPGLDTAILFATRTARMFGYGFLSLVLALYLAAVGLDAFAVGLLLSLTLAGDAVLSLVLATRADLVGRRRTLVVGGLLMAAGGIVFALTGEFGLLAVAAIVGVISPSGNEVGPFLAVEQAALSEITDPRRRTHVFARYQLAGSLATAAGALAAGLLVQALLAAGVAALDAYRVVLVAYALIGLGLAAGFGRLSPAVEARAPADPSIRRRLGLHRSQRVVAGLSGLFALDAFGGGFVVQSVVALWFTVRFGAEPAVLGAIFFGANALAGLSGLVAARLADRIGLLNTMVATHIPSNVLLILVPFMPTLPLAIAVLLVRFSISQMDVPTRQSYTMAVVDPDERSAAAGITGVARSAGAALSPALAAPLAANPVLGALPFVMAGVLKLVYDVALWRAFRAVPGEGAGSAHSARR